MTSAAAGSPSWLAASAVLFIFSGGSLEPYAAKRTLRSAVTVLRPQIAPCGSDLNLCWLFLWGRICRRMHPWMWVQISGFSGLRGLNRSMVQICFCGIRASCFCEAEKWALEGLAVFKTPRFGGSYHTHTHTPQQCWVSRERPGCLTLLSFPERISGEIADTFCKNSAAF